MLWRFSSRTTSRQTSGTMYAYVILERHLSGVFQSCFKSLLREFRVNLKVGWFNWVSRAFTFSLNPFWTHSLANCSMLLLVLNWFKSCWSGIYFCKAHPQFKVNSSQFQFQLRLRLAFFFFQFSNQPATQPATRQATQPLQTEVSKTMSKLLQDMFRTTWILL